MNLWPFSLMTQEKIIFGFRKFKSHHSNYNKNIWRKNSALVIFTGSKNNVIIRSVKIKLGWILRKNWGWILKLVSRCDGVPLSDGVTLFPKHVKVLSTFLNQDLTPEMEISYLIFLRKCDFNSILTNVFKIIRQKFVTFSVIEKNPGRIKFCLNFYK